MMIPAGETAKDFSGGIEAVEGAGTEGKPAEQPADDVSSDDTSQDYTVLPAPGLYRISKTDDNSPNSWECSPWQRQESDTAANKEASVKPERFVFPLEDGSGHTTIVSTSLGEFVEDGFLIKASNSARLSISWNDMFESLGVDFQKVKSKLGISRTTHRDQIALRIAYLALAKRPLSYEDVVSLSSKKLADICRLCLDQGVFLRSAIPQVQSALERVSPSSAGNSGAAIERLRFALVLSRSNEFPQCHISAETLESSLAFLPSCYSAERDGLVRLLFATHKGHGINVLIKGPEGSPKNVIAIALARAVACGEEHAGTINLGNICSSADLAGSNSTYYGAVPGCAAQTFLHCGSDSSVAIQNVDAVFDLKKTEGDMVSFLEQLLEGAEPMDTYFGLPMNTQRMSFVMTAGLKQRMPEIERHCDAVITLHKLSRDEKLNAAREHVQENGFDLAEDSFIEFIVDNYSFDDGTALQENALSAVCEAAKRNTTKLSTKLARVILPEPNREDPRYWLASKRNYLDERSLELAEKLLEELRDESETDLHADMARRRLKMLLGAIPDGTRIRVPSPEELATRLEETHPGLLEADAEDLVLSILASLRSEHPRPILLYGPAGTGKTTLAMALADMLGVPIVKHDFPGMSVQELYGSAGAPSLITESVSAHDGKPGVLFLDEVDKPGVLKVESLCSLLDEGIFSDSFLNAQVDLSRWLVVLTCNDTDRVSPYILNRVRLVELEGYTPYGKAQIAKMALFSRKAASMEVRAPSIDDDALDYLVSLDDEAGLRKLEERIELLIANHPSEDVIYLDEIKRLFPPEKPKVMQGVKILMARFGAKGGAAMCAVRVRTQRASGRREKEIRILFGTPAFEKQVSIARVALQGTADANVPGMDVSLLELDALDSTYAPDSGIGIAVALALADGGCLTETFPETAFIGKIDAAGFLEGCSDLRKGPFFVARARAYDVTRIVCSHDLSEDAATQKCAAEQGIELVGVETVSEALSYIEGLSNIKQSIAYLEHGL